MVSRPWLNIGLILYTNFCCNRVIEGNIFYWLSSWEFEYDVRLHQQPCFLSWIVSLPLLCHALFGTLFRYIVVSSRVYALLCLLLRLCSFKERVILFSDHMAQNLWLSAWEEKARELHVNVSETTFQFTRLSRLSVLFNFNLEVLIIELYVGPAITSWVSPYFFVFELLISQETRRQDPPSGANFIDVMINVLGMDFLGLVPSVSPAKKYSFYENQSSDKIPCHTRYWYPNCD